MKKKLAFLLAMVMIISALPTIVSNGAVETCNSAIGDVLATGTDIPVNTEQLKNELDFGGKTITIMRDWNPYRNGVSSAWDNFNAWVDKCEERFNVKIEEKKWKASLSGVMLSGEKPEGHLWLVGNTGGNVYDMAKKGYITPLDNAMIETGIDMTADHYNELNVNMNYFNGKHWKIGIGFARIRSTVLYNKQILNGLGYDIPSLINSKQWTWDKMTEIAKKATLRNAEGDTIQWGIGINEAGIGAMALSNNGQLIYPDEKGLLISEITSENTLEAITQVYDWYNVDKVASTFGGEWQSLGNAFANYKVAFIFGGHDAESIAYNNMYHDFGVAYIPMGPRATNYTAYMEDEYGYVIPAAYSEMATELLLLADELHSWPVEGYTIDDQFRDEWTRYFHTSDQYNMWHNHHFSDEVEKKWDATQIIDTGLDFYGLINGYQTPAYWASIQNSVVNSKLNSIDYAHNTEISNGHRVHDYSIVNEVKATLKNDGKREEVCSVCGHTISKTIHKPQEIKLSYDSYAYDGKTKKPSVIVNTDLGYELVEGVDYKVTYPSGRKNVGTYKVNVKFMGNYSGEKNLSFKILPIDEFKCTAKLSATSYTYNGKVKTPTVTVTNHTGAKLTRNTHYTVTYAKGRKNIGKYKVTVKFKGNYSGTKTLYFTIKPVNISKCSVKLSSSKYTYNGSVKTPTVTVKNHNGTKLKKNTYYTVTYANGRKNVGKYKVTVKMKGNYSGTKTLYFTINPPKTNISKLTSGKNSLKVYITKKSAQVTGYQLQYATNRSFKSAKTKTLTSYKTTSTTISGYSKKKTYYVRVRTYKTVSGKKYYSDWTSYKI